MTLERSQVLPPAEQKEPAQIGQLLFLQHPGTPDTFSGYGLVAKGGRQDHLLGLLMVDRPRRADPQYLAEIKGVYGECDLVAMTVSGERGLLCQMRVAPDSVAHLQPSLHPEAKHIQTALQPLLATPPNPILKVRWDRQSGLWRSEFWIGLPQEMQAVFEKNGPGCFAAEREDMVTFVTCAPDQDIQSFRSAKVLYGWELVEMPSAPIIRFRASILDDPTAPYILEHFLNVEDADQSRILSRLLEQDNLCFDFFGKEYEYHYSKYLPHPAKMREDLCYVIAWAKKHMATVPPEQRDFDRAKADFQRQFPV